MKSAEEVAEELYPRITALAFWKALPDLINFRGREVFIPAFAALILPLAVMTSAICVLAGMRESFGRAKLRGIQAVRVALYSTDCFLAASLSAAAIAYSLSAEYASMTGYPRFGILYYSVEIYGVSAIVRFAFFGSALASVVSLLRLEAAIRCYLGIPRAWVVTIAVYIIAVLMLIGLAIPFWPYLTR